MGSTVGLWPGQWLSRVLGMEVPMSCYTLARRGGSQSRHTCSTHLVPGHF